MLSTPRKVLLIDIDDVGTQFLNDAQSAGYAPNFARFRSSGVDFANFWASHLCSPFRARLLTGTDAYREGNQMGGLVDETITAKQTSTKLLGPWITDEMPGRKTKRGKWHLTGLGTFPLAAVGPGHYTACSGLRNNPAVDGSVCHQRWIYEKAEMIGGEYRVTTEYRYGDSNFTSTVIAADAAADIAAGVEFIHVSFSAIHGPTQRNPPPNEPPTDLYQIATTDANGAPTTAGLVTSPWSATQTFWQGQLTVGTMVAGNALTIEWKTAASTYATVRFEFTTTGSVTAGSIPVTIGGSPAASAANLIAAINNAPNCPYTAASGGAAVVVVTDQLPRFLTAGINYHDPNHAGGRNGLQQTGLNLTIGASNGQTTAAAADTATTIRQRQRHIAHLDWVLGGDYFSATPLTPGLIDQAVAAGYVVIVASDNGSPTAGKATFYEAGLKTPMFVLGTGVVNTVTVGSQSTRLVNATDIWSTVRYLRGMDPGGSPDSYCFADEFLDECDQDFPERRYLTNDRFDGWGDDVRWKTGSWGRAIRDRQWKYTLWSDADPFSPSNGQPREALYNLIETPNEDAEANILSASAEIVFTQLPTDGETMVVSMPDGTSVTFEFDSSSTASPTITAGRVQITLDNLTQLSELAASIANSFNSTVGSGALAVNYGAIVRTLGVSARANPLDSAGVPQIGRVLLYNVLRMGESGIASISINATGGSVVRPFQLARLTPRAQRAYARMKSDLQEL